MHTPWLDFYRGDGPDSEGRTLAHILAFSDDQLEEVHDYIQWLFPLPEPSRFNSSAPLLTPDEIAAARADERIQHNLEAALLRMCRFYGLTPETESLPKPWACAFDHNHLRITRILRSLTLLGRAGDARDFFARISRHDEQVPERTRQFWRSALASTAGAGG